MVQQNDNFGIKEFLLKSFPIIIQLSPTSSLSAIDTLYYSIDYNVGDKKIGGPFSTQNIVDTISSYGSSQTTIKWAIGWQNFNSNASHTATINLPADCGTSINYQMVFP